MPESGMVTYKLVGGPRPIMEAAAAAGFKHCSQGCMQQCLLRIRNEAAAVAAMLKVERAAFLIDSYKDEWGWSDLDQARALCHVMPGCKGTPAQPRCQGTTTAGMKWDEVAAIATAMGGCSSSTSIQAAAVAPPASRPHAGSSMDMLFRALAYRPPASKPRKRGGSQAAGPRNKRPRQALAARVRAPAAHEPAARAHEPAASAHELVAHEPVARAHELVAHEPVARADEPSASAVTAHAPAHTPAARAHTPAARAQRPAARAQRPAARAQRPAARAQQKCFNHLRRPQGQVDLDSNSDDMDLDTPVIMDLDRDSVDFAMALVPLAAGGCVGSKVARLWNPSMGFPLMVWKPPGLWSPPQAPPTPDPPVPPLPPPPLPAPPLPAPPSDWATGIRSTRVGISGVDKAPSSRGKCRGCQSQISQGEFRLLYWWCRQRPAGYVHPACAARLPDPVDRLLSDLTSVVPSSQAHQNAVDEAIAAVRAQHGLPRPEP